jgi:hypothetical protein
LFALVLFGAGFLPGPSTLAHGQNQLNEPGIKVEFPDGMKGAAERVLRVYPRLKRDCEEKLGYRYTKTVRVWICRDHKPFNDQIISLGGQAKPEHIAAVAFPMVDVIVLKSAAWTRSSVREFEIIVQHEISHCLLGHLRRIHERMSIPAWFDEGIAQWVSEGLFRGDSVRLHQALRQEAWIPFADLENKFPAQEGASELAYAQSESMVRFIAEYNDPERNRANIHGILLHLANGESFDQALFAITGLHFRGLEARWSEQKKSSLPFPIQLFPDVFFSVTIVVLALLAFASYRVRRSRRLAEMDASDVELITKDEERHVIE